MYWNSNTCLVVVVVVVVAFISSHLDYCNSLLYGLPAYQIQKLQRVQNSAAHLVFKESKFSHITPLLRAYTGYIHTYIHTLFVPSGLPVGYWIVFKIWLLTFKAIHKLTPTYISELVSLKDTEGRYYLGSNDGKLFNIPSCKSLSTLDDRSFYMAAPKLRNDLPFLLEIYFQLMLSRRLLKLIYFRRHFPANLLFLFFYKEGFANRIFKIN